jgi:hypothetical protein
MYARTDSPKYLCRKCNNKIPIADLGAIFHEEMKAFFTDSKKLSVNLRQAEQTMYKATKPPCEKQAAPAKHAVENMAIEPATKQFFFGKSQMLVTA